MTGSPAPAAGLPEMPDLSLVTGAASALPDQRAVFNSILPVLRIGQAAVKGIASDLSGLRSIAGLVESAAQIADALQASDTATVLRTASAATDRALSPVADAAGRLDDALTGLVPKLEPLAAQIEAGGASVQAVLQAAGALRALRQLAEVAVSAPAGGGGPPVSQEAALTAYGTLADTLAQWTATSAWQAGLPTLVRTLQTALDAIGEVRRAYLDLPAFLVASLHEFGTCAAQVQTVGAAIPVLVRAFRGAPSGPSQAFTPTGVQPLLSAASESAKGVPHPALFTALTAVIDTAVSATNALSGAIAPTTTELSSFTGLGQQVATLPSGAGLQGPQPNPQHNP